MKRIWIARIHPKPRNAFCESTLEADSPEELLKKLLKTKHRAWYEIESVVFRRKCSDVHSA